MSAIDEYKDDVRRPTLGSRRPHPVDEVIDRYQEQATHEIRRGGYAKHMLGLGEEWGWSNVPLAANTLWEYVDSLEERIKALESKV